jgi:hypothetical protein
MKQATIYSMLTGAALLMCCAGCEQNQPGNFVPTHQPSTSQPLPKAEIYQQLRGMILSLDRAQLNLPNLEGQVLALATDWRLADDQQATVVVVADGAVSMYYNTGGGFLGMGEKDHIHELGKEVLKIAEAMSTSLDPVPGQLPETEVGHMRMTIVTDEGLRSVSYHTDQLRRPDHDFHQLASGVQGLITLIREHLDSREGP